MRLMVVGIVWILLGLVGWRIFDQMADRAEVIWLHAVQPSNPSVFQHAMIADLPEPAARFFRFSIAEGTPLLPVAAIEMKGQFSLGDKESPNYMTMQASQVLAAPTGFIWRMRTRSGHLRLSGSDGLKWTRFWMGGLLPVAHAGGDADHARSAFGRMVAEAVFWTPAAVLPSRDVSWEQVDHDTARVTVRHNGMVQSVDVSVASDGQPTKVVFQRWSNANPDKVYRLQPFGGYLSRFQDFQGYRLPTHIEAGNHFGTDAYFPFFIADVTEITFPESKN
ncbi:DUF6544 family protein [uncultured Sulfitobacter sp.]|uniref:DUF6544 family protein n=1 Tax=uncultured Sulfitobacter sp. TaxID=191468 RepID=UPI0026233B95|nr:DUF6544 family protein [uncultured Sulfitobacter sp.]